MSVLVSASGCQFLLLPQGDVFFCFVFIFLLFFLTRLLTVSSTFSEFSLNSSITLKSLPPISSSCTSSYPPSTIPLLSPSAFPLFLLYHFPRSCLPLLLSPPSLINAPSPPTPPLWLHQLHTKLASSPRSTATKIGLGQTNKEIIALLHTPK